MGAAMRIASSTLPADFARPGKEVRAIEAAGADVITFHPEASRHVGRTLGMVREYGCRAGRGWRLWRQALARQKTTTGDRR